MTPTPSARRALALVPLFVLGACRQRDAAPETDSSLAQDLALAQAARVDPTVFNDAPASTAESPAARSPRPSPVPMRTTSAPRPTLRRASTPAPVARTPRADAPAPVVAASPAPATGGGIGAGAHVGMVTNGRVCAANILVGDKLTATITEPAAGRDGTVVPAGTTVVLEVASVERADPIEQSRIRFRVRAIDFDGTAHPADGAVTTQAALEPVKTSSGDERTKVIGGAVAGALLGRILGGSTKATVIGAATGAAAGTVAARRSAASDACLPVGAALMAELR